LAQRAEQNHERGEQQKRRERVPEKKQKRQKCLLEENQ
jgi:hypothetical protein